MPLEILHCAAPCRNVPVAFTLYVMTLIAKREFARLRLTDLLPGKPVYRVWRFEYLGRLWLGHTHGFSHALSLYSSPFRTKSIALDMQDAPDEQLPRLSALLGVRVDPSLTVQECLNAFGPPVGTYEFTEDRKTYCFVSDPGYQVGFTILNAGGLAYFTMDTVDAMRGRGAEG